MGKTTIMKLLARRKLPVPDFIDILLVEQEVVGDDRTALESVVAADVELMNLRKRKLELETAMERVAKAEEAGGEQGQERGGGTRHTATHTCARTCARTSGDRSDASSAGSSCSKAEPKAAKPPATRATVLTDMSVCSCNALVATE